MEIHAEAARILKKQQRVRAAGDETSGFLFVQVFCQASTDFGNRTTDIGSADQDGKVTNVSFRTLARSGNAADLQKRPEVNNGQAQWFFRSLHRAAAHEMFPLSIDTPLRTGVLFVDSALQRKCQSLEPDLARCRVLMTLRQNSYTSLCR